RSVISAVDADDIYRIPILLHEQALDDIVVDKLRLEVPPTDRAEWRQVVSAKSNPDGQVDIAMVGKYVQIRDSYLSLHEALMHGGLKTRTRVNIHYVESTDIEQRGTHVLKGVDAILVPGGFGERGIEGKIQAVRLGAGTRAREIFGRDAIMERHRHRYEFNNNYLDRYRQSGLRFSGFSRDGLVEVIELPNHPWFLATQFHPEFTSTPRDGHP